jgi:hypothetical protein
MQAVLVTGELIRSGFGAACRWDLANGWDNGNDHGMYSYNEPNIPNYTPHPAFYHLYYMRRHTGDVLLKSTVTGAPGVVVTATAFSTGHLGTTLVNTSKTRKVVRLNLKDYGVGDRFCTYTLTGTEGQDFSRKVYINGTGGTLEAGGPLNYEAIKANAVIIGDEIRIILPPLSAVYMLVEPGTKQLTVNNEVTSAGTVRSDDTIEVWPNPSSGSFTIKGLPENVMSIEVTDLRGSMALKKEPGEGASEIVFSTGLPPGVYLVTVIGMS